jgi:biopolymer transport protein ExbB
VLEAVPSKLSWNLRRSLKRYLEGQNDHVAVDISKQMARFERFLPTLNILGAISPLLGLLGTVTGMITMFRVITLFGTGDPRSMSGGISEAPVTTQLGLAVAIPILLVHHLLERRLETLLTDMDEKSVALTSMLLEAKKIK